MPWLDQAQKHCKRSPDEFEPSSEPPREVALIGSFLRCPVGQSIRIDAGATATPERLLALDRITLERSRGSLTEMEANFDERVERLLVRLYDARDLIDQLTKDILDSVENVDFNRPSTLRAYVRCVFAMVEGGLSAQSSLLLEGQFLGQWTLKAEEQRAFWDGVSEPSVERPEGGRATLCERTKLILKAGRRLFGEQSQIDLGGSQFQQYRAAIKIRDRLMHPKRSSDLIVTFEEVRIADAARNWYRAAAARFFQGSAEYLTQIAGRHRRGAGPLG